MAKPNRLESFLAGLALGAVLMLGMTWVQTGDNYRRVISHVQKTTLINAGPQCFDGTAQWPAHTTATGVICYEADNPALRDNP